MAVSTKPHASKSRDSGARRALGDLLYADKTKTRVCESEWRGLVTAIAAGDQSALHAFYVRTHRIVFTLIMRIMGNRASAEELTVDVFHDVWKRAAHYDPADGPVIGWIMNQARSRAIDRLRFEQRKKRVNPFTEAAVSMVAGNDLEEAADARQLGRTLHAALEGLSAEERQALETAFYSEISYAEVAERLNQPVGTIKTRIRSALMKLRRAMISVERDS